MKIKKLSKYLGVEISDINLSKLTLLDFKKIDELLLKYHFLCFKKQKLSPQNQIKFSKFWGELEISDTLPIDKKFKEVSYIIREACDVKCYGGGWHFEYGAHKIGAMGLVLHALEIPETGGETQFINMINMYEKLSFEDKQLLENVKVKKKLSHKLAQKYASDKFLNKMKKIEFENIVPIIKVHPKTNQKILNVDIGFTDSIIGEKIKNKNKLLNKLKDNLNNSEFIYTHKWEVGDVIFFDNRCVLHKAVDNYNSRRVIQRTLIKENSIE